MSNNRRVINIHDTIHWLEEIAIVFKVDEICYWYTYNKDYKNVLESLLIVSTIISDLEYWHQSASLHHYIGYRIYFLAEFLSDDCELRSYQLTANKPPPRQRRFYIHERGFRLKYVSLLAPTVLIDTEKAIKKKNDVKCDGSLLIVRRIDLTFLYILLRTKFCYGTRTVVFKSQLGT